MRPTTPISSLLAATSPWDIHAVMQGALQLNMTFHITTRNETRVIPSTIYIEHDLDYLYVAGEFKGMGTNPTNEPEMMYPNYLDMFFDAADDGKLTFPEAGSSLSSIISSDTWHTSGWYRDHVWTNVTQFKRESWIFGDEYYDDYRDCAEPASSCGMCNSEYDNATGTLTVIFSRRLYVPEIAVSDALQIRHGECWVVGFMFELGLTNWNGQWADYVDGWPQKFYPYLSNDCSQWPKLAIDLTNPPASFTSNSDTQTPPM
jgi:hypothetical protein